MPKISVIVPVYKVELYLRRCIDSILNQSFTDFELILVDDGSPDHCGEICDEYEKQDDRVRVIRTKNAGVSSARNAGLDAACGEFISFVDSDDWIHHQMFELLIKAAEEYSADAVTIKNLWCKNDQIESFEYDYVGIPKKMVPGTAIKENIYDYLYGSSSKIGLSCGLWGMYATYLYTGVRFDENISNNEDMEMACRLNIQLKKLVHLDVSVYYYIGNESATRTALNLKQLTMLTSWLEMASAAISPADSDRFYYRYIWQFFDYELKIYRAKDRQLTQEFKKYEFQFRSLKRSIYKNRFLSYREKIIIYLYLHNTKKYRLLYGKYERYMLEKIRGF